MLDDSLSFLLHDIQGYPLEIKTDSFQGAGFRARLQLPTAGSSEDPIFASTSIPRFNMNIVTVFPFLSFPLTSKDRKWSFPQLDFEDHDDDDSEFFGWDRVWYDLIDQDDGAKGFDILSLTGQAFMGLPIKEYNLRLGNVSTFISPIIPSNLQFARLSEDFDAVQHVSSIHTWSSYRKAMALELGDGFHVYNINIPINYKVADSITPPGRYAWQAKRFYNSVGRSQSVRELNRKYLDRPAATTDRAAPRQLFGKVLYEAAKEWKGVALGETSLAEIEQNVFWWQPIMTSIFLTKTIPPYRMELDLDRQIITNDGTRGMWTFRPVKSILPPNPNPGRVLFYIVVESTVPWPFNKIIGLNLKKTTTGSEARRKLLDFHAMAIMDLTVLENLATFQEKQEALHPFFWDRIKTSSINLDWSQSMHVSLDCDICRWGPKLFDWDLADIKDIL